MENLIQTIHMKGLPFVSHVVLHFKYVVYGVYIRRSGIRPNLVQQYPTSKVFFV